MFGGHLLQVGIERSRKTIAESAVFALGVDLNGTGTILFDHTGNTLGQSLIAHLNGGIELLHLGKRNTPGQTVDGAGLGVAAEQDGAQTACGAHIPGQHGLHDRVFVVLISGDQPHIHITLIHQARQQIVQTITQQLFRKLGLGTQRQQTGIFQLIANDRNNIHGVVPPSEGYKNNL